MFIRKWSLGLAGVLLFTAPGSTFAFSDLDHSPAREEIEYLENHNIISGITETEFQPEEPLSHAQGVAFLVKGLGLNIDNLRFIKAPQASDYFTRIDDAAWYSTPMMIAHLNGLQLDADIAADETMTRAQFAILLWQGVEQVEPDIHESGGATGSLQDRPVTIQDVGSLTASDTEMLKQVIDSKLAVLDEHGNFRPEEPITRAEAAVMLYKAMELTGKTNPYSAESDQDGHTATE